MVAGWRRRQLFFRRPPSPTHLGGCWWSWGPSPAEWRACWGPWGAIHALLQQCHGRLCCPWEQPSWLGRGWHCAQRGGHHGLWPGGTCASGLHPPHLPLGLFLPRKHHTRLHHFHLHWRPADLRHPPHGPCALCAGVGGGGRELPECSAPALSRGRWGGLYCSMAARCAWGGCVERAGGGGGVGQSELPKAGGGARWGESCLRPLWRWRQCSSLWATPGYELVCHHHGPCSGRWRGGRGEHRRWRCPVESQRYGQRQRTCLRGCGCGSAGCQWGKSWELFLQPSGREPQWEGGVPWHCQRPRRWRLLQPRRGQCWGLWEWAPPFGGAAHHGGVWGSWCNLRWRGRGRVLWRGTGRVVAGCREWKQRLPASQLYHTSPHLPPHHGARG